jgi:hypothetical protein
MTEQVLLQTRYDTEPRIVQHTREDERLRTEFLGESALSDRDLERVAGGTTPVTAVAATASLVISGGVSAGSAYGVIELIPVTPGVVEDIKGW